MTASERPVARAEGRMVGNRAVPPDSDRGTPPRETDWVLLLRRTADRDAAALATFYDATSHLVFGLALRILGERGAAEDTVIETYAQVWREAAKFDSRRGSVGAWLLTLTRSRAIDLLRSRDRDPVSDPLEVGMQTSTEAPGPEDVSADAERSRFVRGALTTLSGEQREAIELAYFAGLSHTEIAVRLGQPLGTVKTRIRLGMMRLRELLDHLAPPAFATTKGSVG